MAATGALLQAGRRYRVRDLNLGKLVVDAIERHGQFAYRRYGDPQQARSDVRQGRLAFLIEIPAEFSPSGRAG